MDTYNKHKRKKRQWGSFLALSFIALLGITALVGPEAVSGAMAASVDRYYDEKKVYDLKLTSGMGFTESDLEALSEAEVVQKADSKFDIYQGIVSENEAINTGGPYNTVYVWVKGAKEEISSTDEYRQIVNHAREYIELHIEPERVENRVQDIKYEISMETDKLSDQLDGVETEREKLDLDMESFDESYEKAMADFDEEQEVINEAKDVIENSQKNAQDKIESGKQDLTRILNEVYSKANVTSSDLNKAQGASAYVKGTESSYHQQFTSQWAELSKIETDLHEQQVALQEEKGSKEQEYAEKIEELEAEKKVISEKIAELKNETAFGEERWVIEDRGNIEGYAQSMDIRRRIDKEVVPAGDLIFSLALIFEVVVVFNIIRKNKKNIKIWGSKGLSDRIIMGIFIRKSVVAVVIGGLTGMMIALFVVPSVAAYAYAERFGFDRIGLGIDPFTGLIGLGIIIATTVLTVIISYKKIKA